MLDSNVRFQCALLFGTVRAMRALELGLLSTFVLLMGIDVVLVSIASATMTKETLVI